MKTAIKEIEADLGRELTEIEVSLIRIAFHKGHSKGYKEATEEAIKLLIKK